MTIWVQGEIVAAVRCCSAEEERPDWMNTER
jgi:hypothetical protein